MMRKALAAAAPMKLHRSVLVAATVLLAACSLMVDAGQQQCHTDQDCTTRGGLFAGSRCVNTVCVAAAVGADAGHDATADSARADARVDAHRDAAASDASDAGNQPWACLGHHPAPTASSATATFKLTLTDFFTNAAVTTVTVKACASATDPSCALPEATRTPDATGTVTFALDTSQGPFTGYFWVSPVAGDAGAGPDASGTSGLDGAAPDGGQLGADAYLPSRIYYSDDPIAGDFTDSWSLITGSTEATLTKLFGLPPVDTKLGIALLTVLDCNRNQATGVSVAVDQVSTETEGFYEKNGTISATATQTDSSGVAGFVNVPVGARTFTVDLAATKAPIGSLGAYVFPGAVTYANIGPAFTAN